MSFVRGEFARALVNGIPRGDERAYSVEITFARRRRDVGVRSRARWHSRLCLAGSWVRANTCGASRRSRTRARMALGRNRAPRPSAYKKMRHVAVFPVRGRIFTVSSENWAPSERDAKSSRVVGGVEDAACRSHIMLSYT